MRVALFDTPGALASLTSVIAGHMGNIIEINHNRAFSPGPLGLSEVVLTLETRGPDLCSRRRIA